jgi:hypothetical protein
MFMDFDAISCIAGCNMPILQICTNLEVLDCPVSVVYRDASGKTTPKLRLDLGWTVGPGNPN